METAEIMKNKDLAHAYVKAYGEVQNVVKNAHNPAFGSNYADLGAVLDVIKEVFPRHGLALYQAPGKLVELAAGVYAVSVVGILMHESGQTLAIETTVPLGPKFTPQAFGGACTYARRYQASAIAGIAQVDDDGNAASGQDTKPERKPRDAGPSYVDVADSLVKRILAATTLAERDALKGEVTELGDQKVADAFVARGRELKKGGK